MSLHDAIVFVLTLLAGFLGVPIIQYVKERLGLQDAAAEVLAVVLSGLLAIVELVLTGQIVLSEITLESLPLIWGLVYALASVFYQLLKNSSGALAKLLLLRE